jgi:hypothetical protein
MGRLQRIEEIVNGTISHYGHVKIFPRGLPRFIDPLLRGTIRFGKQTGNSISVISTDNTYKFAEIPQKGNDRFELQTASEWITLGSILSMGLGKELVQVKDISDTTIILNSNLNREYDSSDKVLNYAHPMEIQVDAFEGDTLVTVRSHYNLANGDFLAYLQTDGLLDSITEIKVLNVEYAGSSIDPFYTHLYNLTLESGITRGLPGTYQVYVRAYPAYFSANVRVPNSIESSEPIGPFVLDIMSGALVEGSVPKETLALRALNRSGQYVMGNSNEYTTIYKNYMIGDRPWSAHTIMFWELAEGTMRMTPNRVIMRVNEKTVFCAGQRSIPSFPSGKSWKVSLISNDDCTIRFVFDPHPFQEFTLASGVPLNVTVTIPPGDDVTRFEINIKSISSICEVSMSDWTPSTYTVESLEYTYVFQAIDEAKFQATGLILKPHFLSTDLLRASYDSSGANADGGKIYF